MLSVIEVASASLPENLCDLVNKGNEQQNAVSAAHTCNSYLSTAIYTIAHHYIIPTF